MKHDTDYKFSDEIKSVRDFRDALESGYSLAMLEKRSLDDKLEYYQLTIYTDDSAPDVQYELYNLDDCLKIATSRVDFMYHLAKRGCLVAGC